MAPFRFSIFGRSLCYVPGHGPLADTDLKRFKEFLDSSGKLMVLTGAGVSTESGIPDYRSQGVGLYATSKTRPVLIKDFIENPKIRSRYWARNFAGWPRFSAIKPNPVHMILKDLEDLGLVGALVTQNVDNLHTAAGSKNVIELHGTTHRVVCLGCDYRVSRFHFQQVLADLNPNLKAEIARINPDGDVEVLGRKDDEGFTVAPCPKCGGDLKPDVVFFGDNVPQERAERVSRNLKGSDSLLVLGSSLNTLSSYRIVLQASDLRKPIALVNIGPTRADELADLKVEARCGEVMTKYYATLCRQ